MPRPALSAETPSIARAIDTFLPIVFLDKHDEYGKLKISDAEARTVREVVAGLLARGIAQEEIGIIAPYRAQVANLRRHLFSDDQATGWRALSFDTPLSVDTVDRFQGEERPGFICFFVPPPHQKGETH